MEIIKQIEKQIRKKLNQIPLEEIWKWRNNGYAISNTGQVMGLNLDDCQLKKLSFLKDLSGLTHLSLRVNQLTDLAPLSAMTNLTTLWLYDNQLTDLAPLSAMTNLTILDLSNNQLTDLAPLSAMTNLTILYLNGNQLTDLAPLSALTNLTTLGLSNNQLTDLAPLSAMTNLTKLYLNGNQLTDLAPLSAMTNLIGLYLDNNQLTDLAPLSALTNLTILDLRNNQLTDLAPLSAMTNLIGLYLDNNQLTDLAPLSAMTNLTILDLNGNQVTDLAPLSAMTNLTELYLSSNQVTGLAPLSAMTNLTILDLNGNQLTDLAPLRELKLLESLNVRNNRIQKLPPDITTWWPGMELKWEEGLFLGGFNLYGNPFNDPPVEIVKQGKMAIENYFAEIQQASVHFLECKLLLVGSGDVGKTTLMKKLKDNTFVVVPGNEDTTRGIDIQTWQLACSFPGSQTHDVNIHFWDFGGQDILHATHQFFLTKRSLYLFVWDPRKEEETRSFDYWLNAVKLFGAGSPLVMVMNKADLRIKHIDEASFKDKFPNIAQFHQVSCLSNQNIPDLTQTIRSSLCKMPHLLDKLPKRWMDIRSDLKDRPENYITLDDYFALCHTHGMTNDQAMFLSEYLHDLGIILHFHQDPVLSGTVILKPEWATGAVYALIDSLEIQKNKGRFSRANLGRYWDKKKYPPEKYPQLLRLIEKFELCFNIVGTDEYILPELLPSQRPTMAMEPYHSGSILQLHYIYEFMPAGIITRFISRIHYLIKDDHYWNTGVELHFSGSSALVVGDTAQKRIRISVTGCNNTQLMGIIRSHFEHIHSTLNMNKEEHVSEEVPCICPQCISSEKPYFYEYSLLQKLMEKNRDAFCKKSSEDISVHRLLKGSVSKIKLYPGFQLPGKASVNWTSKFSTGK